MQLTREGARIDGCELRGRRTIIHAEPGHIEILTTRDLDAGQQALGQSRAVVSNDKV